LTGPKGYSTIDVVRASAFEQPERGRRRAAQGWSDRRWRRLHIKPASWRWTGHWSHGHMRTVWGVAGEDPPWRKRSPCRESRRAIVSCSPQWGVLRRPPTRRSRCAILRAMSESMWPTSIAATVRRPICSKQPSRPQRAARRL